MSKSFSLFFLICGMLLVFYSCDTGQKLENQAPETRIFVDQINLEGDDRLRSTVSLNWIGEDVDGFVVGYEISLDEVDWIYTERTDTVIKFILPAGNDSLDQSFFVRAIDNEGAVDPTPDQLVIPLKNTPPVALFDTLSPFQDTFFTVFALPILVDDADGSNSIDSILIKANDGPWLSVNPGTKIVSVLPQNPEMSGIMAGEVYEDLSITNNRLEGIKLDGDNTFFIKAVDIAGSASKVDTSKSIFIKRKTGDLLLIDDHQGANVDSVYTNRLNRVYPNYDLVDMTLNTPTLWNPTFRIWVNLYDKVLWYGDGRFASGTESLLVELAANEIQVFLSNGGKMLFTSAFTDQFNQRLSSELSPIFEFTPMDSLGTGFGRQPRLSPDSLLVPTQAFASELDPLQSSIFAAAVYPYFPKDADNTLFKANVTGIGGAWVGPTDMIGRTQFINGETNVVFSSFELHLLTGNSGSMEKLLDVVLNQYFSW
ncbi:MAG: hypothetical protein MRZ79_23420 [Bacteroidia bacterium]|nr:hypothetical protein [Bacteroidia bacterium]